MQRNKNFLLFSVLCSGFSFRRSNRVYIQLDLKLEELVHQTDIKLIRFRCVIGLLHVGCLRCLRYSYIPIDNLRLCKFEGFSVSYYMLEFGQNQIPDKNQQQTRERKIEMSNDAFGSSVLVVRRSFILGFLFFSEYINPVFVEHLHTTFGA